MNTDPLKLDVEREQCESDHSFFTRRFFLPRMGFKFKVNWHHVYICEEIQKLVDGTADCKHLIFNVPPGSGKTELCGGNLVAHGLAIQPRSRFLYLSYSEELVSDVLATAKNIVASEEYQSLWNVEFANDSSAKRNWKTLIDGFYAGHAYGNSLGGQITGRRAGVLGVDGFSGLIVIDDPIKPEDAFSDALRGKATRKLINTVQSRKAHPDVGVVMIMQRLHVDDPTGYAERGDFIGDWKIIKIPALIDDAFIATLPEHIQKLVPRDVERDDKGRQSYWTEKERLSDLLQLESGKGSREGAQISRYTFASQYMQEPIYLGGDLIKSEWFGRYDELPKMQWRAIWADTAQKTKEHNDFSVFLVAGLGVDNNLYLIDLVRGKWEAPQLRAKAAQVIRDHKSQDIYGHNGVLRYLAVEDKASGTGLIQDIQLENSFPVKAIQRDKDKLTRLYDVQSYIESGRVFLPKNAAWTGVFLQECEAFKSDMTHAHDDQVDPMIDAIVDMLLDPPMIISDELLGLI